MTDGFFDIILFGLVAAFLVLRLRSVLGRRTGNERPPQERYPRGPRVEQQGDNVVELPNRAAPPLPEQYAGTPVESGITQIKLADPSFNPEQFLAGAKMAFEMIVTSYARGDSETLRPLLSPTVFENFMIGIEERETHNQRMEFELIDIRQIRLEEARMDERDAVVTVRFVSEQRQAVLDSEGRVIDGDPTEPFVVTDLWTFSRDTRSEDPSWLLVATNTVDEE